MIKRKLVGFVCVLVFAVILSACGNEVKSEQNLPDGFVADNSKSVSELDLQAYPLQDLQRYFGLQSENETLVLEDSEKTASHSIEAVNQEFPIECLRDSGRGYYTIYKVEEGGYYFVFWVQTFSPTAQSTEQQDAYVYFTAYLRHLKSSTDFDSIIAGTSTAEDVFKIDQATELCFLMSNGIYSFSLLNDGKILEIKYEKPAKLMNRTSLVVQKMEIFPKDEAPSKLAGILEGDLP